MNMWDTAGFSVLYVKQISATLPSSIIIQPPVLFHATKVILYQSPKAVLSFLCLLSALAFPLSDKLRFPSSPATCSSGLPPPAPILHLNALEQNFCTLIWLWERRTGSYLLACDLFTKPPFFALWAEKEGFFKSWGMRDKRGTAR